MQLPFSRDSGGQGVRRVGVRIDAVAGVATPRGGGAAVRRGGSVLSSLETRAGASVVVRDSKMLAIVPQ